MHGPQGSLARLLWRFAALLIAVCAATLLAGTLLLQATLRNAQQDTFAARFALAGQRAATAAENALALGAPLAPGTPLADLLAREAALEPALLSFAIVSPAGQVLLAAPARAGAAAQPVPDPSALAQWRTPIRNDLGQAVAWVQMRYDASALHSARQQLEGVLWRALVPALLLVAAGLALYCGWLARRAARGRTRGDARTRLVLAALVLLATALLWLGARATAAGQASMAPDQRAKAAAVARSSAALVARALEAGVPLRSLAGVGRHTEALRARSPEIMALAIHAPDGELLAGTALQPGPWTVAAPVRIAGEGAPVARVLLQLDPQALARQLRGTLLDMAFLGAICLLLALEWVALGLGTRGARALSILQARNVRLAAAGSRAAWRPLSAAAVRPALFLFMLSEEVTRPFLPTWARALAPAHWGLPADTLAGLPLVVFLALVALLQWPLASWSERFGRRSGLVLGALLGAAGLAWAAWVPQFQALLGARALGAVGFAMVFVSAQGAVIDGSSARDRARSLAQFVRAILVAGLCGPPLGGMLAERWGTGWALAVAAGLAALAAAVAWGQMPATRAAPAAVAPAAPLSPAALLRQPGLAPLLLGCALPAKLLLAGLCFYLLPLHLQDLGYGSAATGRLQTLYPLTMVLLVPLAARLADRWGRREVFVCAGGLLAGACALLAWPGASAPLTLALALLGLGAGQALSITPQSALVADRARSLPALQGASVLGLFRLTERGGSALGPVCGAWLLPVLGFGPAAAVLGAVAVCGSLAYGWTLRRPAVGARRHL
ncbi:MFS transporter [Melaminivora sp.]|uniref:MFS transporter n=1 Tax=Melaminivora sp. TaxID=1933032 RepID=UPI0028A98A70|nr:MFS transporter [Melaminivora sp.]